MCSAGSRRFLAAVQGRPLRNPGLGAGSHCDCFGNLKAPEVARAEHSETLQKTPVRLRGSVPHSSILCQASGAEAFAPRRSVGEAESGIEYRNYAVCIVQDTGRATAPLRPIFLQPVSTSPSSDLSSHFSSSSVPTIARAGLQASARAACLGILCPRHSRVSRMLRPGFNKRGRCWRWRSQPARVVSV